MTGTRIEPTVGRVVWYYRKGFHERDQPQSASIAHVNENGTVNLGVLDKHGNHSAIENVPLVQGDDPQPGHGGFCEWMPYQKGQAAKYELLEKKLESPPKTDPVSEEAQPVAGDPPQTA